MSSPRLCCTQLTGVVGAKSPPPPSDLLGEDAAETPAAVPEDSAEIGNKRNQLENTQRNLSSLEKQQADLEKTTGSNTSQLAELETNLTNARAKHDEVSKIVTDLRSRVSDQQEKVKNLNMDFIAAESDLSALRSEKDELEQALLRDKEEVRGLQRKMKEVDDEKATLKNLLEKLKKEARQQKGMVTIAKKQLSTSETNRDAAQKDLDDHHKSAAEEDDEGMGAGMAAGLGAAGGAALGAGAAGAAGLFGSEDRSGAASPFGQAASPPTEAVSPGGFESAANVPLPATPKALSPVATGASSRSNNPFDRLRTQSRGPAPPPPQSQSPAGSQAEIEPTTAVDETTREEASSPGNLATGALVGATTAAGLAAGVAVAGASAMYGAAKEAVTGDEDEKKEDAVQAADDDDDEKTPRGQETDPFGATSPPSNSRDLGDTDAFGAPSATGQTTAQPVADTDPFGASTQPSFDNFDSGFGDSFASSAANPQQPATAQSAGADFDSAFADFDEAPKNQTSEVPRAEPSSNNTEEPDPISPGIPLGVPKSALPDLRPNHERTDSTQAIAPASAAVTPGTVTPAENPMGLAAPVRSTDVAEDASSDEEDEGPEDLDRPMRSYGSTGRLPEAADEAEPEPEVQPAPAAELPAAPVAVAAPAVESGLKGRRSAPPPPASRGSSHPPPAAAVDDLDPFGAPSSSSPAPAAPASNEFAALPPGAAAPAPAAATAEAGPQTSKFDDDDFDFSDMPPAQVDSTEQTGQQPPAAPKGNSAFDDEFAGFDDEFESVPTNPNSGSERSNMSKSFEMVTPNQESAQLGQQAGGNMDEWGMGGASAPASQQQMAQPTSAFSFDDAFGGDFEPA